MLAIFHFVNVRGFPRETGFLSNNVAGTVKAQTAHLKKQKRVIVPFVGNKKTPDEVEDDVLHENLMSQCPCGKPALLHCSFVR